MDIARPDLARKRRRNRLLLLLGAAVGVLLASLLLSRLKPAAPAVEKATLVAGTVKRGPMLREVRGTGTLVPEDIRWIPATSAGRIEQIRVLPGAAVQADTVLVELSNPELVKEASDAQWQLTAQEAQFEKTQVQLESEHLTQEATVARIKTDYEQAKLEAEADEGLAKEGLMAVLSAKGSRTRADNLAASYALEQQRVTIGAKKVQAQLKAQTAELEKTRARVRLKVGEINSTLTPIGGWRGELASGRSGRRGCATRRCPLF
jgi:HlyD family secretion protein